MAGSATTLRATSADARSGLPAIREPAPVRWLLIAVSLGFLSPTWQFMGTIVSQYDALILIYGCMTGLMAVTLGLIPSVIGEPQWMPRGSQ